MKVILFFGIVAGGYFFYNSYVENKGSQSENVQAIVDDILDESGVMGDVDKAKTVHNEKEKQINVKLRLKSSSANPKFGMTQTAYKMQAKLLKKIHDKEDSTSKKLHKFIKEGATFFCQIYSPNNKLLSDFELGKKHFKF